MQRSVKLCEFVSVSLTEHKLYVCCETRQALLSKACVYGSVHNWTAADHSRTEPHYPHKQQTQPCVFVCACVTGICTDRNEHNYTLVSPQTCRQPSTTENNKKNIMYLLLQLHTTQKTLMYTKIYPHTQPVMRCTFTTSQVPRDPFTSFQHS